jgi:hypothetical protein
LCFWFNASRHKFQKRSFILFEPPRGRPVGGGGDLVRIHEDDLQNLFDTARKKQ